MQNFFKSIPQDYSFTEDQCRYLMFPVKGGSVHPVNKLLGKHESIPVVSDQRVCIKSCGRELDSFVDKATTPAPTRLVYSVGVKLKNLAENFDAPKRGSPDFETLSNTISDSFNGVLNDIPGYYKIDILGFEKEADSIKAKMNLLFDKAVYEKGRSLKTNISENNLTGADDDIEMREGKIVKRALLDSIATGKVGSLQVDPQYLDFEAIDCKFY